MSHPINANIDATHENGTGMLSLETCLGLETVSRPIFQVLVLVSVLRLEVYNNAIHPWNSELFK